MDITQSTRVLKRVLLRTFSGRTGTGRPRSGLGVRAANRSESTLPAGAAGAGAAGMGIEFVLKFGPKISLDSHPVTLLKITGILKARERVPVVSGVC
jgi:hypothetical protein